MSRSIRIPLVVVALAALAGCATSPKSPDATGLAWVPRSKTNVVSHQHVSTVVRFIPGMRRPTLGDPRALAGFVATYKVEPGDEVSVTGGSAAQRLAVVRELARLGLPGARDSMDQPAASPTPVLVLVDRYTATVPNCPDWSKPQSADFGNTMDSNFGCANAYDLGQMVANPHDLLRGRNLGPGDAAEQEVGIDKYEQGQAGAASATTTTTGTTMTQPPANSSGPGTTQ